MDGEVKTDADECVRRIERAARELADHVNRATAQPMTPEEFELFTRRST